MLKMAVCLLALAAVAAVQAAVVPSQISSYVPYQTDIEKAAQSGDWAKVHQLIALRFQINPYGDMGAEGAAAVGKLSPLTSDSIFFTDVRNLKPPTDRSGKVYGKAESSFKSTSNNHGQVSESSGGYKIINDNGHVTEFKFNPYQ